MRRRLAIARTPLRVSFVGGGSDLPGREAERHDGSSRLQPSGATLSSSIDKHVYCVAKRRNDSRFYLTWREKERVDSPDQLRHEIAREVLKMLTLPYGVELLTFADVPGTGSGLGSSAATTVAMIHALLALDGWSEEEIDRRWLAEQAAEVEINKLGRSCGRQDQYASGVGGLLHLEYDDGKVHKCMQLDPGPHLRRRLNETFMLFSPPDGDGRSSETVLREFSNDEKFREECVNLTELAVGHIMMRDDSYGGPEFLPSLVSQHHALKCAAFPSYLPEQLERLSGLDYKLCGAGATGHLLVGCSKPEFRLQARSIVPRVWGSKLPFEFVEYGSKLVYFEE